MAHSNIQELNDNYMSGYPMISPDSNNKEVYKKENMISYEIYSYNSIISVILDMIINIYQLHEQLFMIVTLRCIRSAYFGYEVISPFC